MKRITDRDGRALLEYDGDLKSMDWDQIDLTGASLQHCCLRGAVLTDVIFRGANLRHADLGRNNLGSPCIVSGADFSNADLHGTNFEGALWDDRTRFPEGFSALECGLVKIPE